MRIVSLCPSLTELLFALGRGPDLVGVTKFCVHPAEGVRAIEKVGGTKNPRIERILELEPDLVLFNEEENRKEDEARLREGGIRCLTTFPITVEETAQSILDIGAAVDREDLARPIADDILSRATVARERARGRARVAFAYLIWRDPWMSVNGQTYVSQLLGVAGGRNVLEGAASRYPAVTASDLQQAGPETVLLSSEPFPFKDAHIDELARATGMPPERFRLVDGEMLSWHGSRTPAGIDYAVRLIEAARSS